jgi:hypothetical protein
VEAAEPEGHDLGGVAAGVEQQVAAGDAGVDGAGADVDAMSRGRR